MKKLTPVRPLRACAAMMVLSGCLGNGSGETGLSLTPTGAANVPLKSTGLKEIVLVKDRVTVRGPKGFCVDSEAIRRRGNSVFALLAPCTALGVNGSHPHTPVALLTIQVQPHLLVQDNKDGETLAAVFADMEPLYTETGDSISLIQLAKGGDKALTGGDPKHWRGTLSFNGSLVGLSVYAKKGGSAAGSAGKALLLAFAEEVQSASPIKSFQPLQADASASIAVPAKPATNRGKLFGKLFN